MYEYIPTNTNKTTPNQTNKTTQNKNIHKKTNQQNQK